ncbi:MAG: hypothetical protein U9Q27_03530 [Patescibacteria group bacterium]|nr:hypothetical protein [Patescibacteria group bacterium]
MFFETDSFSNSINITSSFLTLWPKAEIKYEIPPLPKMSHKEQPIKSKIKYKILEEASNKIFVKGNKKKADGFKIHYKKANV